MRILGGLTRLGHQYSLSKSIQKLVGIQCAGLVNPSAMARVPLEKSVLSQYGVQVNSPNGITVILAHQKN